MKSRKSTSSLSKREKMRRKPFNRRNSRSTSLRLLYNSLLYSPGSTLVETGGLRFSYKIAEFHYLFPQLLPHY